MKYRKIATAFAFAAVMLLMSEVLNATAAEKVYSEAGQSAHIQTIDTVKTEQPKEGKSLSKAKIKFGYDGGMMLHTGFLSGTVTQAAHKAQGFPTGIGGAVKFHIGKHFRVGSEGYVSAMKQLRNGSSIKFGWGGVLADCRFRAGEILMPYIGVTIGGGARTCMLMFEGDNTDWENEESVLFNKQPFFAIAPYIGTDFIVTEKFHLTLKADWLGAFSKGGLLPPTGPRLYFGFLMYH